MSLSSNQGITYLLHDQLCVHIYHYYPLTVFILPLERMLLGSTYCHEKLGCFPTDGDFSERPINFRPNSRETIDTKFKVIFSLCPLPTFITMLHMTIRAHQHLSFLVVHQEEQGDESTLVSR